MALLQHVLRRRGGAKARRVIRWLPDKSHLTVLDLGAGEGYVGEHIQRTMPTCSVVLADVVDFHRVDLPFVRVDENPLPFDDDQFDVAVLAYVLHHARDSTAVLREALRVARRVIILESVYRSRFDRQTLATLDRMANAWRSRGVMDAQLLAFKTHDSWQEMLRTFGNLIQAESFGRWPHLQAEYVLDRRR